MKEQITSRKKKLLKVRKNNVTVKDRRFLLFCFTDFEQVFFG